MSKILERVFDAKETAEIRQRYNLANVASALAGDAADIGFEREISDHLAARNKSLFVDHGGITVPYAALSRTMTGVTDVDGSIVGNGAATVGKDILVDEFASPLAARLIVNALGARMLDGLAGDVAIPKSTAVAAGWATGEGASVSKVNPTFSQVVGSPHMCGAYVDITRKLLLQSSLAVQDLIGGLILDAIARAVDAAALAGTGSDGQPTGLVNTSGVNAVSGITADAPTYANLLSFVSVLDGLNVDMSKLRWLAPAAVKAKLSSTLDLHLIQNTEAAEEGEDPIVKTVGGVTSGRYLCEKNLVCDYPILTSGLAPAKKLILGDWQHLLIGAWGEGITLVADRYTNATAGAVRLVAVKDVDVMVRYPEAFAVGTILS